MTSIWNQSSAISKTRGQLLREKINNLCNYLKELQPEKNSIIESLRNLSNEEIVIWICQDLLPYRDNLSNFVDNIMIQEGLQPNDEIHKKLLRYSQFFVKFLTTI